MYTPDVPTYTINLALDEHERWAHVIRREKKVARRLVDEGMADFEQIPRSVIKAGGWAFKQIYSLYGGRYVAEMEAWADALDITVGEAVLMNCSYELSHITEQLYGCTAGVRWVDGLGMVHVRSMDWPLETIGPATRIFHFVDGGREFYSVGIVGHVSVLSGMVPGAYSVTINWAPPAGRPKFDWGPSFLLREVLEECDTYNKAVEALTEARLSTPVFFTVCGTKKGQACVIERTHAEAAIRKMKGSVITQANHHVAKKFVANNGPFDAEDDSVVRAETLKAELESLASPASLDDVAACLDVYPVCNEQSFQQMAFCPATGELQAWRWLSR